MSIYTFILFGALLVLGVVAAEGQTLPNTQPLTMEGDLAEQMVAGMDTFFTRKTAEVVAKRKQYWHIDPTTPERYLKSIEPNRQRFRKLIGAQDARLDGEMRIETVPGVERPGGAGPAIAIYGVGNGYEIYTVRWNVFKGVEGEGLLLVPDKEPVADIIALPECDWTPEMLVGLVKGVPEDGQYARRLAENGCRVLVPFLIDRGDTYSGIPGIGMTNQPHREFIYRAAYEMGRHIIGFEVQKTLAVVDWFKKEEKRRKKKRPIGVIGYGEGGLLAFYSAAVDTRIDATVVSGYFQAREELWREPIYRNIFGLLREFGDAEIASLIVPRALNVEICRVPAVSGPPQTPGRGGAAPGMLATPDASAVLHELERLIHVPSLNKLMQGTDGGGWHTNPPGGDATLTHFLNRLGVPGEATPSLSLPKRTRKLPDSELRRKRQFEQLVEHTQVLMRESVAKRAAFWAKADATNVATWKKTSHAYRERFWDEIIGRLPPATLPANPRSMLLYDTPKFRGYQVVLDVYPDIFTFGILLVPKGIKPGEKRPVVVCQHGLEGRPQDVADPGVDSPYYHQFACKLAERGFITYAPQNPYIGEDKFRVLLRKAQPLGLTLFSVIVRQHQRTLDWLSTLPYVDPKRIAFYGLSYGGKTAMRVPAVLERYCLSICSADYNEWVWKNASAHSRYSYLLTGEYDMPEFNLANTFNYAEMSWLICPRPFMVERGHDDGVAPDEWVAHEFARTRRHYVRLGVGDRAEIEFFNGPHTIHGVGTFDFLQKHLQWPKPKTKP